MAAHPEIPGAGGEPERDLLDEVPRLIAALEAHPDREVGAQVTALLQGIDTIHRTALTRLVGAIQAIAGEAFMNRLTADPAIRLLLTSYDLLAVDRRLLAEEALDTVRGHLHAHGIDVELASVVGGAVYVKVHGLAGGTINGPPGGAIPEEAVRHDLEEALRAGLAGFQELVLGDRPAAGSALLQIGGLRQPHRPVYRRACAAADVPGGAMKAVEIDGHGVLVANVEGRFHAVADRCGDGPLPLRFGTLQGAELRCSWHGCRYDVRTGHRLDGGPERLAVLPVAVENDDVRVAIDVEPVASP
ncbi:MAG TPA: Rieske 2Fe-2S domain-containing protein [Methylomirabilota bacterium]